MDQAKQFSLVLNAELPLVRLAERNAFRAALINYQRAAPDLAEHRGLPQVPGTSGHPELAPAIPEVRDHDKNFVLTIRQKDQAFEQIIAPPQGTAAAGGGNQAPLQTTNLIQFQSRILQLQNTLVLTWQQYELHV